MNSSLQAELNKALARALESEALYKSVLESQTDLISRFRSDWTFIYVNDAFCRYFNKSRDDLVDKNWAPLPHPDDVAQVEMELSRLSLENPIVEIENRVSIGDGTYRWCHFINKGIFDKQGNLIEVQSVGRDINEHRIARQLLLESEQKYRLLISTMTEGVVLIDDNSLIIAANESAEKIFGLSADQLMGPTAYNPLLNVIRDDGTPYTLEEIPISRTLKTGQPLSNIVNGMQKPNGEWVWMSINTTPYFNEGGSQPYRIVATIREITKQRLMEKKIHDSSMELEDLYTNAPCVYYSLDVNGIFVRINAAGLKLLACQYEALIGKMRFTDFLNEKGKALFQKSYSKLLVDGHIEDLKFEVTGKNGKTSIVRVSATVLRGENDKFIMTRSIMYDLTDLKIAEQKLAEKALSYKAILDTASDGIYILKQDGALVEQSDAFLKMLGYSKKEAKSLNVSDWNAVISKDQLPNFILDLIRNPRTFITKHKRKDGSIIDVEVNAKGVEFNGQEFLYASSRDISDRKAAEALILKQANYDQLTQLPNRRLFQDRMEREIKKAEREQRTGALLFIDLDSFKDVNDTQGHDVGDLLLIEAARRIKSCVRSYDTVARLGGDEFAVILADLNDRLDIDRIAQSIIDVLRKSFLFKNIESFISASIGISIYPDDAANSIDLLKSADQAMYQAKLAGKSRFHFFTRTMQQASENRRQLTQDLRHALSKDQLEVYYQPIIDLSDNTISKAEALLRWNHPERGQISPAIFIPIAEDAGLIYEIGDWVYQQAAIQTKKIILETGGEFQISINQSPLQFNNPERRYGKWREILSKADLSGRHIIVEITERLLMSDNPIVTETLLDFRDDNIQVSIDDFGTGYSALSYLKKFDVDYLKIDQSFVANLALEAEDFILCEAIIAMAHKLGLKVIAEGVETMRQHDLLRQINCDYGQGYLFSKPLPFLEFESLLKMTQQSNS